MTLSYVDFIAPNVEVCVKYLVNNKFRWFEGVVVRVLDRFIEPDTETECVKCIVLFDNDRYTETFKEIHYNNDNEDAWCFGDKFVQLVEQIKYLVEDQTSCDSGEETDCTDVDNLPTTVGESETDTESDDNDSDYVYEEEHDENNKLNEELRSSHNKKHSLANNVGAALFMLSPWIASAVVLFNARHEIMQHLRIL